MIEHESTAADIHPIRGTDLDRWVWIAFMTFGLFALWLLDKLITLVWDRFAEPQPSLVTLLSFLFAVGATWALHRQTKVRHATHEVVAELAKVSWPTRRETQVSTMVVIVTSLIAAIIVGSLDAVWSALTDYIYKA